jgi:hypothetical protein
MKTHRPQGRTGHRLSLFNDGIITQAGPCIFSTSRLISISQEVSESCQE